jgi:hypothetical protein
MELTFQTLFNIALALISFGLGFIVNRLFQSLDALREQDNKLTAEITAIRIALPTNYVTKPDMEGFVNAIFKKLDIISNKLDGKVDKS